MTKKVLILLVITFSIVKISSSVDYCNIKTCNPQNSQTMCRYQSSKPAARCDVGGDLGGGLTSEEMTAIVNRHNQLRRTVANGQESRGAPGPQPAAKRMPNLVWDNELATVAQRWANQCNYDHDQCRNVERFKVGQNIAYNATTGDLNSIKVLGMVQGWYDEVKDFNRNDVSSFKGGKSRTGEKIGHYTQIVWAETTRIGCGLKKYVEGGFKRKYLVCNYGPTGNFLGEPLYEIAPR